MRVRALLHLEHEGLGLLRNAFASRGAEVAETNLWKGDALPEIESFDFLVLMGGAMNVDEEDRYPWLAPEKALIARSIAAGKRVLGICLGAQLIARALGAAVRPMGYKEIGWFPVRAEIDRHPLFPALRGGERLGVAHWHGDAFDLPPGCDRLFSSEACREQGFAVRGKPVVGLQFHAELDGPMLTSFISHGADELAAGGKWVQSGETALKGLAAEGSTARAALERLVAGLSD
jgi:GMP synthase (glutamine-hydrolysing)